jgi:S-DNA-T family DNA segregation ATPase FtsK/SpoIIIE
VSELMATGELLESLESFRAAIRDFAAREEALNREYRNLTETAELRYQQQMRAAENEHAAQVEKARAETQAALDHVQGRFAARERRLHDGHASARKLALERVDHEEGRRKYAVQKGTFDADRRQTELLAANDAALADFRARLEETRAGLDELAVGSRTAFRGMVLFQRLLRQEAASDNASGDHEALLAEAIRLQTAARNDLSKFRGLVAPRLFRSAPLWVWTVIAIGLALGLSPALHRFAYPITPLAGYAYAGTLLALALGLYAAAYFSGVALASGISSAFARGRLLLQVAEERAVSFHASEIARIKQETRARVDELNAEWESALAAAKSARDAWPEHLLHKWHRARTTNELWRATETERIKSEGAARVERIRTEAARLKAEITATHQQRLAALKAKNAANWERMEREWRDTTTPQFARLEIARSAAERDFPAWDGMEPENWHPPQAFKNSTRFGRLELDLTKYAGAVPHDKRLALAQSSLSLPLLLQFPREGSLLFETSGPGKEAIVAALNNLAFRLLATTPAGKLSFTIFDPVSLGQNFAPITHLADYEENLIDGRIWTQPDQIEQRLADLNEHMEKVIQMYLRNEYPSIVEYNAAAGNIAEKYRVLIIADFPANLSENAARRLLRIATSGARCGVFTWILWDHRQLAPPDHLAEELRKSSLVVKYAGNQFVLAQPSANPGKVVLDAPPSAEIGNKFLERVGETSRGASRVEVPFSQVAPRPAEEWTSDTSQELRVPIGRSGANKLQYMALGRGTRQHVLLAGKTGSGKSTLFHVMITNLALWCSPEQVEFYLVDFKKGVEFKSYATHHLPHARVIAIESDREFGLSVLQRVDEELRRRGELFRQLGVQDIAAYKAASRQPLPRTLLMIDEFQEFFVEEDRVAQAAAMLLDRIVRQGRAFGIHVILGSQTLGGAYTLARATLGQMAVRIALQSNETDAYLIMDENNAAPRLLSRPGEGIYNDMAGATEGNSPFQVVWLSEAERANALQHVQAHARGKHYPAPVVFEGNAPADVRENAALTELLAAPKAVATDAPVVWLGAPNAIKGPTEVVFHRRSGSNLIVIGQREESVLTMFGVSLTTLDAQFPPGSARFVLLESTAPATRERAYLDEVVAGMRNPVIRGDTDVAIAAVPGESAVRTFVFIHNLQNFKRLRVEDEFSFSSDPDSPAAKLARLITDGAANGIHLVVSVDTYSNVTRFLGRKGLAEFGLRVLFQMSPNDSASLIDDSRASNLGMYRALFYNEPEGRLETFRPYARPERLGQKD